MILKAQLRSTGSLACHKPINTCPHQPIRPPPREGCGDGDGGGLFFSPFHLPVSPYFSLSTSLTARHPVVGTAALIFLHGRQRNLKATITAENYQFPFPLTLWEERRQGRGHETRKRDKRFKFGMRLPPHPTSSPQGV